jgi:hypothetical protein
VSLIVEDGSIVAGAESYVSVAAADAYHAARNNAAWAALPNPDKEAALRKATDYMQQTYRLRWRGARTNTTQSLDWPRFGCYVEDISYGRYPFYVPTTVVPAEVQHACAELALKASTAELNVDLDRETASEKVGSIQVDYVPGGPQYRRYRAIDQMLKVYLASTGISGRLVRS